MEKKMKENAKLLELVDDNDSQETSLFDGLLQRILQGFNFIIDTSTDNEIGLGIIIENTSDAVIQVDSIGTALSVNQAFQDVFGYSRGDIVGQNIYTLVPEEYHLPLKNRILRLSMPMGREGARDNIFALRGIHKKGTVITMECLLTSYIRDRQTVIVAILRDLSFDRALFHQLKETKEHYNALTETISEVILRIDEKFEIQFTNSAVKPTFGYEQHELIGKPLSFLFPASSFDRHKEEFRKYLFVDNPHRSEWGLKRTIEFLGRHKNRGLSPMELSFGNPKDCNGRALTCIIRDITQRKNAERRLRHLAYHDTLTNLGNRELFDIEVKSLFKSSKQGNHGSGALMYLDLDGFKKVNDTLGHEAGDSLLVETAGRLCDCLRESDTVFRFGGDEFVILLPDVENRKTTALVAVKVLSAVRQPYYLDSSLRKGALVNIGVSIGIAMIPDDGGSLGRIVKSADLAMYSAKEQGKNQYSFFHRGMDRVALERWEIEQGIKNALHNNEFKLLYQPLIADTGKIVGVEALIRWPQRNEKMVGPESFIPVAEETDLIVPLGTWVLETACREMKDINQSGFEDLYVSVNLSVVQFEKKNFPELLGGVISRTGINPSNLRLELTETSIMGNPEAAIQRINIIKELFPGLKLLIDDFGTGYSSLSYLSKLPVDGLKIDISFVANYSKVGSNKILNSIINLGHSLEMEIIAEGVETKDQWDYFKFRNCTTMQGFLFSKAIEKKDLTRLLRESGGGRL